MIVQIIENYNLILIFFSVSVFVAFIFFLGLNFISSYLNIFDKSDEIRKIHKEKIPPIGGLIFFIIFSMYCFVIYFIYESDVFYHQKHIIILFVTSLLIFFTGLIDDKVNLSSKRKTIIFLILISILVLNDDGLIIYFLRSTILNKTFALGNISIFFTIFSFFVFINAFNMFDGINLQSGLYSLTIFIFFLTKGVEPLIFIPLSFICLIFLFYNSKNKIFLGNCGSYFLAFLISAFFIKSNIKLSLISVEEILVIMMIPGLDLIRLFCKRLVSGESPFVADRNHIHHLLSRKMSDFNSVLLIFSLTFIPLIFSQFLNILIILIFQIIIYYSLIIYFKKLIKT
tara:strand:+ start:577 stop:1602 length:1026 start_codon:yes stop_codon:yes gene_type:complete